jgi:hypothetical protein
MTKWEGRTPSTRELSDLYKEIDRLIIDEYKNHERELTLKILK